MTPKPPRPDFKLPPTGAPPKRARGHAFGGPVAHRWRAFLAAMFGMSWLVETTNREGTHDAELLPFFALIPLLIGPYHLVRARQKKAGSR